MVEGDSAGGSAKRGRNPRTQAILPLRGKILNVERARLDKALSNQEVQSMITAFGTNIGEEFDITKLRYHKIVLMADADVDGQHITTLMLTLLFRYMRPLIENGYVFLAQPPLYKIKWTGGDPDYVFTDSERDEALAAGRAAGRKLPKSWVSSGIRVWVRWTTRNCGKPPWTRSTELCSRYPSKTPRQLMRSSPSSWVKMSNPGVTSSSRTPKTSVSSISE